MPCIRHEFAQPQQTLAAPIAQPVLPREDDRSCLPQRLMFAVNPTLLIAMGATVVASAQSNSSYATEQKTQAWETPAVTQLIPSAQKRMPQSVTASVSSGLAGMAPSLRLLSAPQNQSDGMTARIGTSQTPVMEQADTMLETPALPTVREAARTVQPSAPVITTPVPVNAQMTSPTATVSETTITARALVPLQAALASVRATGPSVPSRWALGSSHSANMKRALSYSASSQSGSSQARIIPNSQDNIATADRGCHTPRRTTAPDTDWWREFKPEGPLPYAYCPPGTRLSATTTRSAQGGTGQTTYGQASPYARTQTQAQAWEQQGQIPQAILYQNQSPQGQSPQSQTSHGPFTSEHNAPVPQGQTPHQAPNQGQSGPYDDDYPEGYTRGPFDQSQQKGAYSGPIEQGLTERRGWFDRMGLSALSTIIHGGLRLGVGVRENDGLEETFIADADVEGEVSAVTQGGIEWGLHGQLRVQYDEGRKGFTRRLPDCPPTLIGCPVVLVAGTPTAIRGHSSQFYTFGPNVAKDTQIAVESAHLFARSAYGDVTVGRDDGAAYLFSLGAPRLLNVGASNSGVDYTGLDAVRTRNEATGFAEKVTYISPRLLGDQVGIGIQIGASYAPDAEVCGVDYCVEPNAIAGVVSSDIEDVLEAGIALDRTFANGMSVEGTLTYARGSEPSGLAELDDLHSYGAAIEVRLSDWMLGGSFLQSNQGLMASDYTAYDVGLTWQPSRLGFTLGYGHAEDDLVGLISDQIVGGVSLDLNERVRLSAGVQYADRQTIRDVVGTAERGSEKATAIFIEGGLEF